MVPFSTHIQVTLAVISSVLTIRLTNSNRFVTRKDSGVLAPSFDSEAKAEDALVQPKRKIMYFVSLEGARQEYDDTDNIRIGLWFRYT